MQAQCSFACNDSLQVSLEEDGDFLVTIDWLLQYKSPGCNNQLSLVIYDKDANQVNPLITCQNVNQTLTAVVIHEPTGAYCQTKLLIRDYLPPVLTCPPTKYVFCNDSLLPKTIGYPTSYDNCFVAKNSDYKYVDTYVDSVCTAKHNGYPITGYVDRLWKLKDKSGNEGTCLQKIYLLRAQLDSIVFPPDRDNIEAPALDCNDDEKNLNLTGRPTIGGQPIYNGSNCEMVVSFSDNKFNVCNSGAYFIYRTWHVIDYCSDKFTLHAQVIKKYDTKPPVLTLPANITVGTLSTSCSANVVLPAATATDDCSTYTIVPEWSYGKGYGLYTGVTPGVHQVTYKATDGCGNVSTGKVQITVIDDDKPTAVCKHDLTLALPSSGAVTLNAIDFDQGSVDNCSITKYQVKRDTGKYSNTILFNCSDIGTPVKMNLQVTDVAGLTNACELEVNIQDKLKPDITCPADITILCSQDITNTSVTGNATAIDNCKMDKITWTDVSNLNICNTGDVSRIWSAKDIYGNISTCTQNITKIDTTPIKVVFPVDFTTSICNLSLNPSTTGNPVVTGVDCEKYDVAYSDSYFNIAPPACFKIIRTWTINNFCLYDANITPNPGVIKHAQVIEVKDKVAPILHLPSDITVNTSAENCNGVVILNPATFEDCDPNTKIITNSNYADAPASPNASGNYPAGIHTITFVAYDGCGNTSSGTMKITVIDQEPPVPVCKTGLSIPLNSDGIAIITKAMIENGSSDNCSPFGALKFTVTPSTFDCGQLGLNVVTYTATDIVGNVGTCTTSVDIQDPQGYCSGIGNIKGTITSIDGKPMPNVMVTLDNNLQMLTDENGKYQFNGIIKGKSHTVSVLNNDNIKKGINTLDLLLIQKHLLNIQKLNSPYKIIAADVDHSSKVSVTDIIILRKLILKIINAFPNNNSYIFVNAAQQFTYNTNPLYDPLQEKVTIPFISGQESIIDFKAMKVGDVDDSSNNLIGNSDARTQPYPMECMNLEFDANAKISIPIHAGKEIQMDGMQLSIRYNPSVLKFDSWNGRKLEGIQDVNLSEPQPGLLLFSWDNINQSKIRLNDVLFEIQFNTLQSGTISDAIQLSTEYLQSELYDQNEHVHPVELKFQNSNLQSLFTIEKVYPQPFTQEATFELHSTVQKDIQMEIYSAEGQLVYQKLISLNYGSNQIRIQSDDLNDQPGMYYYRIYVAGLAPRFGKLLLQDK